MIHQPEFMPWSNLFSKMACCDHFVFLDTVQYVRRSYQNRNKFKYSGGEKWLTVPVVKAEREDLINTISIDNSSDWKKAHISFLQMAYRNAPHYKTVIDLVNKIYANPWENLSDLNCSLTIEIARYLEFSNSFIKASELEDQKGKSERILSLCKQLKATEYIAGTGSKSYLNEEEFEKNGISINYLTPMPIQHQQEYPKLGFVDGLSIVDYLFNAGAETFLTAVQDYKKELSIHD